MASEEDDFNLAKHYKEQIEEGIRELAEPKTVPLTVYIGGERQIVGKATVIGKKVHAQIDPDDSRELQAMIQDGVIKAVSVSFSTEPPDVPAHPTLPYGDIAMVHDGPEVKYSFEPRPPFPRIEGLSVDHTLVDEEPFRDNFPYEPR